MTMDSNQIVPAAPLDLRTRTRQRGGVEDRTHREHDYNGNSRLTTEVSVESQTSLRTATVNNQQYRTFSADLQEYHTGSQKVKRLTDMGNPAFLEHLEHSPMALSPSTLSSQSSRCTVLSGETGAALKENSERSPSNLPLRKRPFPNVRNIPPSPPSGEHNLSPEKKTELYRRISQQKFPKRDDNEGRACEPLMPPRSLFADGGYEKTETKSNGYHAFPCCPYPVFVFAPMPHRHTQQLLECAALATRPDEDGDTALHIAVVKEEEALVYGLIHLLTLAHKDLDTYNNLRQTPLHLAVITHQAMLVEALLRGGSDSGALDRNGQTALHLCCEHAQRACLTVLLSQHASSTYLEIRNFDGLTPLHLAVQGGHVDLVTLLLEAGASINAMDNKSGQTPLMHAVESNNGDMVQFLIERGCDVNRQSYSGNTALHGACGRGQVDTVRLLLKNGADSSLKNYHNDTPVMVAKNKRVTDVLRGKGSKHPKTREENSVSACLQRNTSHRVNDSLSPKSDLRCSRSTTPLPFHHRAIKSPRAPPTSSPHSQSTCSLSGPHSPIDTQEREPHPVMLGSNSMAGDDRVPQGRAYPLPRRSPPWQTL